MNKKVLKIAKILLIVLFMVILSANFSMASIEPGNLTGNGANVNVTGVTNVGNSIIAILRTVGIVLSVVVLIILGIKYMMGSAEEKADYKKTMIPYVVGAALIFAASALAQVVYNFFIGITA